MDVLLNTSNPLAIIILTLIVALIIFLARKSEKEVILIVEMVCVILLLVYHSVYLDSLVSTQEELISQAYHCLAADLILLLISFISFLWVDDIVAKKKKLKSYDDSLSWFWNKL